MKGLNDQIKAPEGDHGGGEHGDRVQATCSG